VTPGLGGQEQGRYVNDIQSLTGSITDRLALSATFAKRVLAEVTPPADDAHGDYPATFEALTQLVKRCEWAVETWRQADAHAIRLPYPSMPRWWQFWRRR
jgi:hypothetical protein